MEAQWQMGREETRREEDKRHHWREKRAPLSSFCRSWAQPAFPCPPRDPSPIREQRARTEPVREKGTLTSVGLAQDFRSSYTHGGHAQKKKKANSK